jgi:hypothetical protein
MFGEGFLSIFGTNTYEGRRKKQDRQEGEVGLL